MCYYTVSVWLSGNKRTLLLLVRPMCVLFVLYCVWTAEGGLDGNGIEWRLFCTDHCMVGSQRWWLW